jgi:hypothetical protein
MTSKTDRQEAIARLHELLEPGDTITCVLRGVSRSGMTRWIDFYVVRPDDRNPREVVTLWLTRTIATACEYTYDRNKEALKIGGCGMDMGFAVVYDLCRVMYPDGFGVEGKLPSGHKIRPKTRAMAAKAVKRGATFYGRNGDGSGWDNDGGYALKHRWLG